VCNAFCSCDAVALCAVGGDCGARSGLADASSELALKAAEVVQYAQVQVLVGHYAPLCGAMSICRLVQSHQQLQLRIGTRSHAMASVCHLRICSADIATQRCCSKSLQWYMPRLTYCVCAWHKHRSIIRMIAGCAYVIQACGDANMIQYVCFTCMCAADAGQAHAWLNAASMLSQCI
jgi:hypothetical protein